MIDDATTPAMSHRGPDAGQTVARGGLFSAASWREWAYSLVGMPVTVIFFCVIVALLAAGAALTVVYIGMALLIAALALARLGGAAHRGLARALLRLDVATPPRLKRARPGPVGLVRDSLADVVAWRAVCFVLVRMVWAPVTFVVGVVLYSGFGAISYPVWRPFLPAQQAPDGTWHRGAQFASGYFVDTWPRMALCAAIGLVMVAVAPYVLRALLGVDRALVRSLLGGRA